MNARGVYAPPDKVNSNPPLRVTISPAQKRHSQEKVLPISQELLDLLVCPVCKTPVVLTANGEGLRCAKCRLVYPIRDGFPIMIKDEAISEAISERQSRIPEIMSAPRASKTSPARNLEKLAARLRGRRIGVVGDLMLDRYVWGSATRLSPEAAVPVVDFVSETSCLGGAGNVAANLAALGASVTPFGVTGADEAARDLRRCLTALGMPSKGVIADAQRSTTLKTRIIARHQQVVRVDREHRASLAPAIEQSLIRAIKASLPRLHALVISDYDKGVVTDALAERVLDECRRQGVPALVKPKTTRLFAYRGARAIVCNKKEAGFFVTRQLHDRSSIEEAGRALLAHFGCAAVIITLGEDGLSLFEESSPRGVHVPATSFEVNYARVGLPGVDRADRRPPSVRRYRRRRHGAVGALACRSRRHPAARRHRPRQRGRRRSRRQTRHRHPDAGRIIGRRPRAALKAPPMFPACRAREAAQ